MGVFDILARDHHEVGELVNDDDNERHLIGMISVLVGKLALLNHLVVEADVLGTDAFEDLESALHLGNSPLKGARSLFGLGDWRNEEMRDAVVKRHFDALRINENHANLGRRRTHEYGHDHGIKAHRLARTRRAGNEQVRHLGKVDADLLAIDILADGNLEWPCAAARQDIAKQHARAHLVGNLYAHERSAGNLCDAHG